MVSCFIQSFLEGFSQSIALGKPDYQYPSIYRRIEMSDVIGHNLRESYRSIEALPAIHVESYHGRGCASSCRDL
jgi:hypothetical protein